MAAPAGLLRRLLSHAAGPARVLHALAAVPAVARGLESSDAACNAGGDEGLDGRGGEQCDGKPHAVQVLCELYAELYTELKPS